MTDIVCLLKTPSLEEAYVIESVLLANDIPVCLGEAEMARQNWTFMVISGIRVLVPADFLDEAAEILISARRQAESGLTEKFGALGPSPKRRDRWVVWAYAIFSFDILLLGLMAVFAGISASWLSKYKPNRTTT